MHTRVAQGSRGSRRKFVVHFCERLFNAKNKVCVQMGHIAVQTSVATGFFVAVDFQHQSILATSCYKTLMLKTRAGRGVTSCRDARSRRVALQGFIIVVTVKPVTPWEPPMRAIQRAQKVPIARARKSCRSHLASLPILTLCSFTNQVLAQHELYPGVGRKPRPSRLTPCLKQTSLFPQRATSTSAL